MKSQSEVLTPEEYFLRPILDLEKSLATRTISLSLELNAKIQAQEEAGQLVIQD
ncbi:MAG: hypothetical protein AB7G75_25505 [Candidatus Binatia bacterium]